MKALAFQPSYILRIFLTRFDFELEIPVPNANARVAILRKILSAYKHNVSDELIQQLGRNASHGFVGSDISLVCTLASSRSTNNARVNIVENIEEKDLIWAFSQVKPSAMREILVQIPNVRTDLSHFVNLDGCFRVNCIKSRHFRMSFVDA